LSDGLEGRTSNPVALLFDALSNPHADVGARLASLLRWEFHPEREIPHVVLGRYDEGGIWQVNFILILYFTLNSLSSQYTFRMKYSHLYYRFFSDIFN